MNAPLHSFEVSRDADSSEPRRSQSQSQPRRSQPQSQSLSTPALCAAIGELCARERRTEWLLCRHLAELADRFERRDPALSAYADIYQLARLCFDMGVRRARERIRIGRALDRLPRIDRALSLGRLGYTKARELTRVATADDEAAWLTLAEELSQRQLERRVAEAAEGREGGCDDRRARTNEPAAVRWLSPASVELSMVLPASVWALLERAMHGARQGSEAPLCDAEALAALVRDALAKQSEGQPPSDVRHLVVLYRCKSCERTELETGTGAVELEPEVAARLGCGAKECDLEREGLSVKQGGALPARIRRAVLLRDRMRCRAPGCTRRRYVDVHHIRPREHGGEHSRRNCLCLCDSCHRRVHEGLLRIEGDAAGELCFFDASGTPLAPARPSDAGDGAGDATPWGHAGDFSEPTRTVWRAMGKRGGWHTDPLCEQTGLPASAVMRALCELELAGHIAMDPHGSGFAPVLPSPSRGAAAGAVTEPRP